MNVTENKQQVDLTSSERRKGHGKGNATGGKLFTPKASNPCNGISHPGCNGKCSGQSSSSGNPKGLFGPASKTEKERGAPRSRKDNVYKAKSPKADNKPGAKAGSRRSKFTSKGNDTKGITAEAVGIAIAQAEGECDGLRDTIKAHVEDKEDVEAVRKLAEYEASIIRRKEEEEARVRILEAEEEERKKNIPKGFSFSTRATNVIYVAPILLLLYYRWLFPFYWVQIFVDTWIVVFIFCGTHSRLHTYRFVKWLQEPARDHRSDHHKQKDYVRKCEYAQWEHIIDYHWDSAGWGVVGDLFVELICKDTLLYYLNFARNYVVSSAISDGCYILSLMALDVDFVLRFMAYDYAADTILVYSRKIGGFYYWLFTNGGILQRPYEKFERYIVFWFKSGILYLFISYQFQSDNVVLQAFISGFYYSVLSWYVYWMGLISVGKRVLRRVRKLHVSHGAYCQITVFKNIDRTEQPKVAFERIKNSAKSLCSVNFDSREILNNIDVLGETCDLALGFFEYNAQSLEDFLLPHQQ